MVTPRTVCGGLVWPTSYSEPDLDRSRVNTHEVRLTYFSTLPRCLFCKTKIFNLSWILFLICNYANILTINLLIFIFNYSMTIMMYF